MQIQLQINGKATTLDLEPDEPLLWALRDGAQVKGPKFGCGAARCGACTVLVDGQAVRSCVLPAQDFVGKEISTIESLSEDGTLHPVQQAWIEYSVPQCGYCQCGQIMSAVALLKKIPNPQPDDIDHAMAGNLCRCGTYPRIVKAIQRAAQIMRGEA